jgi:acyl-CoA thioesterase-1
LSATVRLALLVIFLASSPACARTIRIVAFGDSLTYGWLLPRAQAYPDQLQAALRAKGYDVAVKNAGVPGDTAENALKRFDQAIDPSTDICILEFGLNDRNRGASLKTIRARVAELVWSLRARRIEVLVLGLGGLQFADLAAAHGVPSVDFTLPPHKYRARDGAHFNAQGNAMLVARLLPPVEKLIARVRAQKP